MIVLGCNRRKPRFQCSSASRKFLKNIAPGECRNLNRDVSVLFSEPKIPQICSMIAVARVSKCFSALQRAENSSKLRTRCDLDKRAKFQCSSASRKFLKHRTAGAHTERSAFQCSSASRKFLKRSTRAAKRLTRLRFSALQRAENSSNCSCRPRADAERRVSVLFSEPKIPQTRLSRSRLGRSKRFQCSSASRKFLKMYATLAQLKTYLFQCSSASRKFLKGEAYVGGSSDYSSFSALQRAENSSKAATGYGSTVEQQRFSALQRAENSSKRLRFDH